MIAGTVTTMTRRSSPRQRVVAAKPLSRELTTRLTLLRARRRTALVTHHRKPRATVNIPRTHPRCILFSHGGDGARPCISACETTSTCLLGDALPTSFLRGRTQGGAQQDQLFNEVSPATPHQLARRAGQRANKAASNQALSKEAQRFLLLSDAPPTFPTRG